MRLLHTTLIIRSNVVRRSSEPEGRHCVDRVELMAAGQRGKDKQSEVSRAQDWSVQPRAPKFHLLPSLSIKENNETKGPRSSLQEGD